MNLWHYTREPFQLDSRSYDQDEPHEYGKPKGLWVSVEGKYDWQSWCEGEEFCLDQLAYRSPVALSESANVLCLTPGDIQRFDTDYSIEWPWGENGRWTAHAIDWREVADRYDGIIIAPYSWHHRLLLNWYYNWDCSSGCIWNLDAISVGASELTPATVKAP